jgi:hypothetical protein
MVFHIAKIMRLLSSFLRQAVLVNPIVLGTCWGWRQAVLINPIVLGTCWGWRQAVLINPIVLGTCWGWRQAVLINPIALGTCWGWRQAVLINPIVLGTCWGCLVVAETASLSPVTVFRPYSEEIQSLVNFSPAPASQCIVSIGRHIFHCKTYPHTRYFAVMFGVRCTVYSTVK